VLRSAVFSFSSSLYHSHNLGTRAEDASVIPPCRVQRRSSLRVDAYGWYDSSILVELAVTHALRVGKAGQLADPQHV
jgi:hypothetical protein